MTVRSPSARCPACGAALAADGGWCPRCALAGVFAEPGGAPGHEADRSPDGALFTVAGHVVLAELGRGAAGIVYRARQRQPDREVALKILRPHEAGSEESRARFRLEAVALAGLDHPLILPVFNVGEHDGLPYFTMKLCIGGSLAERLGRYEAKWREIAELMATLADAVHYAHVRGVLHRDLKPGNVLFDEGDRPFISDFGLAKLLEAPAGNGPVTRPLLVMGTPGYLAPEVLAGGAGAATTAADVYALGAILRQLITGEAPSATPVGRPGVPRDLAVIAAKCLRAEPGVRYAAAGALAEDLRAWLAGRPIAARPLSAAGHAAAWARRNPALAGVSAAALLLLLLVTGVSTVSAVRLGREQRATAQALERAEAERKRATAEAANTKAIADFLQNDLLAQAAPDNQPDRDLKLRTVLDRAAQAVGSRFADRPAVEAGIRETLAGTYRSLGEFAAMQGQLGRAIELDTRLLGAEAPLTLRLSASLALPLFKEGKMREAEALARKTLASQQRVLGSQNPDVLETMGLLATICTGLGQPKEARSWNEQMLELSRRVLGPEHPTTLAAMYNVAVGFRDEGRLAEAEPLFRQAWAIRRRTLGPEAPLTLSVMSNLALLLDQQGNPAEAEALTRQVLAIRTRILGPDHPDTLNSMGNLALNYEGEGKFAEAEAVDREIFASRARTLGPENPTTLVAMGGLANIYLNQAKYEEAEALYRRVVEIRQRVLGPEHPQTLAMMNNLALACEMRGQLAEAERLDTQALAAYERVLGPENVDTLIAMRSLALVYQDLGRLREAETLFARRLEISRRVLGPQHPGTLRALEGLGGLYLKEARFGEAEPLLREALRIRASLHPSDWQTALARSLLGGALAGLGKDGEAEPLLVDGYTVMASQAVRIPGFRREDFRAAGTRLVEFYQARNKPAEAEAWRQKVGGGKSGS